MGDNYQTLKKTIVILIADFRLKLLQDMEEFHTKWHIHEEKNLKKVLTEDLELHIIELPKAKELKSKHDTLLQWLAFLDNPNKEGVLDSMKENKDIAEALWKLEEISEDKKLRRIAELKERWEIDERSAKLYWKETGLEEGRKKGIKEGRAEGRKEEKEKIAKAMLEKQIDLETIRECTRSYQRRNRKLVTKL